MMFSLNYLLCILAFLMGAIPFSVIIGKAFFGVDVRKSGSGNPGATNTLRVLGTKAGLAVLLLDTGKGIAAVQLFRLMHPINSWSDTEMAVLPGACSILGHMYSPFLRFKGGKGVATSTGVLFALSPIIGLIITAIFALMLILKGYVSLASIVCAAIYPIIVYIFTGLHEPIHLIFACLLALMIIFKHRSNIERLLSHTETKFKLSKKSV